MSGLSLDLVPVVSDTPDMPHSPDMTRAEPIDAHEVARRLDRSPRQVERLVQKGYLNPDRPGGRLRFDPIEVEQLREAMSRGRAAWVKPATKGGAS